MGRKTKYSADEKINTINAYLAGKGSLTSFANKLGVNTNTFIEWVNNYESMGAEAFYASKNKHYTREEKLQAVQAYLAGEGSYVQLCKRFKITTTKLLRNWVKRYNGHEKLNASGIGGTVIMTKGRTTTFDERVEIASYCIAHNHNYTEASEKFNVSYQQARNYTVKYEEKGIIGLQDNRGRRKTDDSLSEIEKLKAELKLEKAKRTQAEMEVAFLKKLDEIERRRG